MPAPQLIAAPASDDSREISPLAYLDAYDAVLNDDYALAASTEIDRSTGAWRVRTATRHLTGVVFEPEMMRVQARAASAQGRPFFTWGAGIDPSAGDPRSLQYRVNVEAGKPARIEIAVQLRKVDGSPDAPMSASIPWPT